MIPKLLTNHLFWLGVVGVIHGLFEQGMYQHRWDQAKDEIYAGLALISVAYHNATSVATLKTINANVTNVSDTVEATHENVAAVKDTVDTVESKVDDTLTRIK